MPVKAKVKVILQDIAEGIDFHSDLSPPWSTFNNLISFSKTKSLFDYQEEAMKNAIKILHLYFQSAQDYKEGEPSGTNTKRRTFLLEEYERRGLEPRLLDVKESKTKKIYNILSDFFRSEHNSIPYSNFINRMSFWMATGSGKTLVIVKLIEILTTLVKRKEIPPHDILILTCREDLVEKMEDYVKEYNEHNTLKIRLWTLKDFNRIKLGAVLPKGENTIDVFIYRSDLISDEEKEKFVDFKNYENAGKWYVLLDEAHKGDKEESKRQAFYSIMSRNGFLFNFSATFTDSRDIYTTVYNFNLGQYVGKGYGKNVYVSEQEFEAFREKEDFSDVGKQKIVLKTLILLAYLKKVYGEIRTKTNLNIYNIPMMLTLTHTVNPRELAKEPDLVMFFKQLEKIAEGTLESEMLEKSKAELAEEFERHNPYAFGSESLWIDNEVLRAIGHNDILSEVFNSQTPGNIEVLVLPSNKQELAFKLKTSDRPFAMVKIGDITGWLKQTLSGYETIERWENESFFKRINEDDSDINIMMGSRAFYEGWDSNRPNLVTFINIGIGVDARKFVTQSLGRGARIEPIKNKRKRISYLRSAKDPEAQKIIDTTGSQIFNPIETLFIFGTKKAIINEIVTTMKEERLRLGETLSLDKNAKTEEVTLLIPCYKQMKKIPVKNIPKFTITKESLALLKSYVKWIDDDKVLLNLHFSEVGSDFDDLIRFKEFIEKDDRFTLADPNGLVQPALLIPQIISHVNIQTEELERFKKLEEEIVHFKRIGIYLSDEKLKELKEKIEKVKKCPQKRDEEQQLHKLYGKIAPEEYDKRKSELERKYAEKESFSLEGKDVGIYYVADHYYLPLLSTEEKIDWISHIIKTPSEHQFIKDLMEYTRQDGNLFEKFDWWLFSKIDEHLDEVYVPYYDSSRNFIRRFKPDFIFWLCKNDEYHILLVDPKGISHTEYQYKADGYKDIFLKDGKAKEFPQHGFKIKVHLQLFTEDVNRLQEGYREYWFDNIPKAINELS
jgi:hypothetical protein